ncbi:NADPH-dependent FMN reductase [Aquamicrobium ahrensii]|uniref:NAD(P)H-dependent FMN reductase n=1 Tax=Aquamicrobium ahrensii TaxID=469551 RepID=A0ABV2KNT9_9HYPH
MTATPRLLVFAGSVRSGAFSGKTADVAQKTLALQGVDVTRISLLDYTLPIYDQDLEKEEGIPQNAMKLARLIASHDGMLIATPEYNGSVPPLLKNTIDWLSRVRRDGDKALNPLAGKAVGLCSSSEGQFAGIRAISHLRAILQRCQMDVVTPECSVPRGGEAFDDKGDFRDERLRRAMARVVTALVEQAAFSARMEP